MCAFRAFTDAIWFIFMRKKGYFEDSWFPYSFVNNIVKKS